MKIIHRYDSNERRHYLFKHQHTFKLKPRLLYAGELKKSQGWKEKLHTHEFCEIIYISDGRGYVTTEHEHREVKRGDIVIYNPGIMHAEESSDSEPLELKFMALDRLEITDLPRNYLLPPEYDFIYSSDSNMNMFASQFEQMIQEYERSDAFYVEIAEDIARTMTMYILRIVNHHDEDSTLFRNNKHFNMALQYIKENYRNDISLENIAENCYLNKYYLSHLFTRIQGMSIGKYIQTLRIDEAKRSLCETEDSVALIAKNVGFHDTGHFCKTFKKETGTTPLQFRKSNSN